MSAQSETPEWRRRPEGGYLQLWRTMAWLSLHLGRAGALPFLHLIAIYYFLFAPQSRRNMRAYLRRALGREPGAADRYRLILWFARTIQDRLFLLAGQWERFEVSVKGEALMREVVGSGEGAFLFGAHMGSFEILRAVGEQQPGLKVAMAMYEETARKLNAAMATAKPRDRPEIIGLGHIDAMLRISEHLDQGALVGMLADRTLGDEPSLPVSFLGAPAHLPLGPMRAAALLRRRVLFMLGLYRGGHRYQVVFEPVADFRNVTRAGRAAEIEAAVIRYAGLLEQYCRSDPYNWFNFFDFWSSAPRSVHPA